MKARIPKNFDQRRQELAGSIEIISGSIREFEQTGRVYWLRVVAGQLRALVVFKPNSSSLGHPLLLELAKERNYPLVVYTTAQDYTDKVKSVAKENLIFYTTGDPFSLIKDEIYKTTMGLEDAMESLSVEMIGQQLSVKDVLLHVSDTEASHYDPGIPPILDDLRRIEIGGLPTHYRIIYTLGKIVRDLGIAFLQSTT